MLQTQNPSLADMAIDLKNEARRQVSTRRGRALTRHEYRAVVEHRLGREPADGQTKANTNAWKNIETSANGSPHVVGTDTISTTNEGRRVPILDEYVIGSPADPAVAWDRANCCTTAATFYTELVESLHIELFKTARTQLRRATMSSQLRDQVAEGARASRVASEV